MTEGAEVERQRVVVVPVIIPPCPKCHGGMEVNTPRPGIYGEHLPFYCGTCRQYRDDPYADTPTPPFRRG